MVENLKTNHVYVGSDFDFGKDNIKQDHIARKIQWLAKTTKISKKCQTWSKRCFVKTSFGICQSNCHLTAAFIVAVLTSNFHNRLWAGSAFVNFLVNAFANQTFWMC